MPAHIIAIDSFLMDKTEVTNEEYYAFTSQTGYRPFPPKWTSDGRPQEGQEVLQAAVELLAALLARG